MKSTPAALAALAALTLLALACAHRLDAPNGTPAARAATWVETQAEEGFSFSLPSAPDVQRQNLASAAGRLPVVMYIHTSETAAFNVTVARYPDGFMEARAAADVLAGARDGAAEQIEGEIVEQRDLQLFSPDGEVAPGLEIVMRAPGGIVYRGRIFVVAERLIQISYVSTEGAGSETDYRHFVDSFFLTP